MIDREAILRTNRQGHITNEFEDDSCKPSCGEFQGRAENLHAESKNSQAVVRLGRLMTEEIDHSMLQSDSFEKHKPTG